MNVRRLDPLLVGVGGVLGATARYAVGLVVPGPVGTLVANVVGSLALGVLVARVPGRNAQLVLGTGLLSSFTTYSTFAVESVALGPTGGAVNVTVTHLLGATAALVGLALGRSGGGR